LGFTGYYRRFIKYFSQIPFPLLQISKDNAKHPNKKLGEKWTNQCQTSFDNLKSLLTSTPLLRYTDFSKPFIVDVDTDASMCGLGAVLSQMQDGRWTEKAIAYARRTLRPNKRSERNFSSMKLELLALKWCVTDKFRDYLLGNKFVVYTENNPLKYLNSATLGALYFCFYFV